MKNKKLLMMSVVLFSQFSHAALINISDLDPTNNFMSGGFTSTVTTSGTTRNIAFTGTFDIDGGGSPDTLSFDITYEFYTGSSYTGTSPNAAVTLGVAAAGNIGSQNWGAGSFGGGNTLSLLVTNIVYTSGEADGTTAVFNGYTGIRKIDVASTGAVDFAVGSELTGSTVVTGPPGNGGLDISALGDSSQLYITSNAPNGNVRLRDLDLVFETVPEPSTFGLLGISLAGLLLRRRRA